MKDGPYGIDTFLCLDRCQVELSQPIEREVLNAVLFVPTSLDVGLDGSHQSREVATRTPKLDERRMVRRTVHKGVYRSFVESTDLSEDGQEWGM